MGKVALGLIDGQRGFMPASEGVRLGLPGFGELGVAEGEQIIEPVNYLLAEYAKCNKPTFTTQDWHPKKTAHFSKDPNYKTTWPEHCVANTPGAELHPGFKIPESTQKFFKGTEEHVEGQYDTSYSGMNGYQLTGGLTLPQWFKDQDVDHVVLTGLAIDYCVMSTAIDILQKAGIKVSIVLDATRAVAPETGAEAINNLQALGVDFISVEQAFALAH